jgi:hypothetical protein
MVTSSIFLPAKLVQVVASGVDGVEEPSHPASSDRVRIRNNDHTIEFLFIIIL